MFWISGYPGMCDVSASDGAEGVRGSVGERVIERHAQVFLLHRINKHGVASGTEKLRNPMQV